MDHRFWLAVRPIWCRRFPSVTSGIFTTFRARYERLEIYSAPSSHPSWSNLDAAAGAVVCLAYPRLFSNPVRRLAVERSGLWDDFRSACVVLRHAAGGGQEPYGFRPIVSAAGNRRLQSCSLRSSRPSLRWHIGPRNRRDTMPFDEGLAERIRRSLGRRRGLVEKKMFGGVAFFLMATCVSVFIKTDLIVRLAPAETETVLAQPHTRRFDLTGRPMKGWILVEASGLKTEGRIERVDGDRNEVRGVASGQVTTARITSGRKKSLYEEIDHSSVRSCKNHPVG